MLILNKQLMRNTLLVATTFFYSCRSNTNNAQPINEDSIINALNAVDTISKIPQKVTDSINKAYLDSFKKNVDTNNAEFRHPH